MKILIALICLLTINAYCIGQPFSLPTTKMQQAIAVKPAAERMELYLPMLKGKAVSVFANQTSMVLGTHLVDTLLSRGIRVTKIFGPEHGFRGVASAGEKINNGLDKKSGLPIISLYGSHKKPTSADLKDVDVVLFDIQDVGVRFYTYISSLEYLLEACIENNKPLIILDRPNPNGFYVDGPVLDKKYKSFIGMQPIPIVYGMTMGEYAQMLIGQKWLASPAQSTLININKNADMRLSIYGKNAIPKFNLTIITCDNYTHATKYELPVPPSPNLTAMQAIYLYPSTCLFEGTVLSEGRGTAMPFQIYGHPSLPKHLYSFTPMPNEGAKSSKCYNQLCYGYNLSDTKEATLKKLGCKINLTYIIDAYQLFPQKDSFFLTNNFFDKLAGNNALMAQIKAGKSIAEIRKTWDKDLAKFKAIRKKYLLYKDF